MARVHCAVVRDFYFMDPYRSTIHNNMVRARPEAALKAFVASAPPSIRKHVQATQNRRHNRAAEALANKATGASLGQGSKKAKKKGGPKGKKKRGR